ncbi:MAG: cupin domain-containing protein [Pseudomonadota bacterium]
MTSTAPYILAPVTRDEFFARYWEQQPLHVERSDSRYFSHLVSVADIDQLLSTGKRSLADIQIADANRDVRVADYSDDNQRIDAAAVRRHYLEGSTIVLNGGQLKIASLAQLCRSVTQQFVMCSQANVYLSPASQQGFNPHFDTHDVFILQVSGRKAFRFYSSEIELPYTDDRFDPANCIEPQLQHEVTLNAGDTLYIPRGVVHDAVACGQQPSLHITLGVFAIMLRDLLQQIVQIAGENDVSLRR